MSVPRRGVRDIRRMSMLVTDGSQPHVRLLKAAMLSLERGRRDTERARAMERVTALDARIAEIDAEIADLLPTAQAEARVPAGEDPDGPGFPFQY